MTTRSSLGKLVGAGAMAIAGLGAGGSAMAQDVYWSVGLGAPGVQVELSNAPAVPYYPRTVVVQPQPVYVHPAPVHHAYPVYPTAYPQVYGSGYGHRYGRPVVITQPPVYSGWHPGHRGWHRGYGHGNGHAYGHNQGYGHDGARAIGGGRHVPHQEPVPSPHRGGRH